MIYRLRRRFLRRNPRIRLLASTLLVVLLTLLCVASVAMAKAGDKVIADWRADNRIDRNYSLAELDAAKARMQNSQLEYTSFSKELERVRAKALINASGGQDASGADSGPNKPAVLIVGILILLVLAATAWYYLRAGGSSGARKRGLELAAEDRAAASQLTDAEPGDPSLDVIDAPTTILRPDSVADDAPTDVISPEPDGDDPSGPKH